MTKLIYDYESPENNDAVRAALAKLPSTTGDHLGDKQKRAQFREGYAVAQAFGLEARLKDDGRVGFSSDVPRPSWLTRSVTQDDPNISFYDGTIAGTDGIEEVLAAANRVKTSEPITLTPETPTVVSWKQRLAERPTEYLLGVVTGDPNAVDASHMYACQLLLEDRGVTPDEIEANIQSWKDKLVDKPLHSLLDILKRHQDGVDAYQHAACFRLVAEKAQELDDRRDEVLLKLARLVLWLDWLDPVVGGPINHHITDGLAHERDELIHKIMFYTDVLDRVMVEYGGY